MITKIKDRYHVWRASDRTGGRTPFPWSKVSDMTRARSCVCVWSQRAVICTHIVYLANAFYYLGVGSPARRI